VRAGNKPDFHKAMGSDRSKAFYEAFVEMVKSKYQADKIQGHLCATLFSIHVSSHIRVVHNMCNVQTVSLGR
jgi:D-tyrosyl-tRNA(Tyr) deacylase